MRPDAFPTGRAAHAKCGACGESKHVYLFPFVSLAARRTNGDRDLSRCLACKAAGR